MNRELKFRALCQYETTGKTVTEMVYFGLPEMDNGLWSFPIHKSIRHINAYESPLMQYTGLKDKNGKEIYEGDICKRPSSNGTKEQMAIGTISFYKGSFCFHRANASIRMAADNLVYHYSDCEVIDNIYENPELLK